MPYADGREYAYREYGNRVGFWRMVESFNVLYRDGARNGRLLVLNLHPWLIGQPFRMGFLDTALGTIMRRQGVWAATGAASIEWYRQHPPMA